MRQPATEVKTRSRGDAATISAIVPSYNSASVLDSALLSILGQTRPPDEIIVVDDGSTDDTEAVCRAFGLVRYVRQPNAGASTARNRGADLADGGWLAFLDADDEWSPHKLETQLEALAAEPEASFCISGSDVWSESDQDWRCHAWRGPRDAGAMRRQLLVRNIFTGLCSSMLIRREAFDAIGGFADGKCCEDRRIAIDLLAHHQVVLVDEPLIRQRPGPAHFSNPERHRREMILLIEDYADLYAQLDPSGLLRRRAIARMHERSGMHYLENGQLADGLYDLAHAAVRWPFQLNPWRAFVNAGLRRGPWRKSAQPRRTMIA